MEIEIVDHIGGVWCPNQHWLRLALEAIAEKYCGTQAQVRALITKLNSDAMESHALIHGNGRPLSPSQLPFKWQVYPWLHGDYRRIAPWLEHIQSVSVSRGLDGYVLRLGQGSRQETNEFARDIAARIGSTTWVESATIEATLLPETEGAEFEYLDLNLSPVFYALAGVFGGLVVFDPVLYDTNGEGYRDVEDSRDLAALIAREASNAHRFELNVTANMHDQEWDIHVGVWGLEYGTNMDRYINATRREGRVGDNYFGLQSTGVEVRISPGAKDRRADSATIILLRDFAQKLAADLQQQDAIDPCIEES